jgi:endo-1,4-beta-D-glucanase Y
MTSGKAAFHRAVNGDEWKEAMKKNWEFAIFADTKLNEDYYGYKLANTDTSGFLVT